MNHHKPSFKDWKEARRKRAFELRELGWKQCDIAQALGVSSPAVCKWFNHPDDELEREAWRAKPARCGPLKLTPEQLRLLPDCLSHGAEAYGFRGEVWTGTRVATVIEQEFGIRYHRRQVARLLKGLDWTPQLPLERASQRSGSSDCRVAHQPLAGTQKKARQERRLIVFIDEAAFYLVPGVIKTYAPRGERPILKSAHSYDHLSVMSGITMSGKLYTLVENRALRSTDSVLFLKHLHRQTSDKLLVIWDGCPIHRKEVTTFMAEGGAKCIHLEPLPAYAPDLNPDEGVWQHLKHVELRNVSCPDVPHLRDELSLAIMRLRSKPCLIKSFFAGAGLRIKN